ncbi:FecR domain-containing protein [Pseudoalteromonas sp. KG3]|jgi:transmembrane sensor|uniref:FecR domain-containing protein n=1 Tax=Pseudoalteromonas prydzensis TaxID=182141 RepID=A0ABR9FKV0_9GAMM|nr:MULTISPECIES: FecR domain-containing protein [Pseudoalteromonas]MBE0457455.1 FecR domain-containing protein [Pseudoalteromonas prydzensis]WKD24331.1 FecR domain-containing protein [Pseudoalteromonas sp. KG3]
MTNIHQFSSKDAIQAKASRWISAMDRGLSAQERHEFQLWVQENKAHQDAVFELAQIWDELSVLNELSSLFPNKHGINKPVQRTANFSIAASVFAALLIASFMFIAIEHWPSAPHEQAKYSKIYRTKVGEQATFVLPDSTIVQLNTNSLLEVAYTNNRRQLILSRGEGRFNVAKDAARPFTVMAGDKSFTALGTVFNVQRNAASDLELVVTEGKVMITDPSVAVNADDFVQLQNASNDTAKVKNINASIVISGEKALIKESITKPITRLTQDDVQRDLAWQQGMLIFNGEPLSDALQEVSRYTATRFELADPSLASLKVAGVFKAGDIVGLLDSLRLNLAIEHERLGEHIVSLKQSDNS